MLSLPYSTIIYDGSGNPFSSTKLSYDEANGSPQGVLGHLTSSTTLNADANTSMQTIYNKLGTISTTFDGNQNKTFVSQYQCSGLFPQMVTTAYQSSVAESSTYKFDCNTGSVTSFVDPNSNTTTFAHSDLMGRLTAVGYPDNGSVAISYNNDPRPPKITTTISTGESTGTVVRSVLYDGLGRTTETQLNSDPDGVVYVDTAYDPLGRAKSVGLPYRSGSASGSSYTYDALGRVVTVSEPDNSQSVWCYNNLMTNGQSNCAANASSLSNTSWIDYTDGVGRHTQSLIDGLGRLVAVVEPDPISGKLSS